jgi:alkylation response protein AidB-like acyl-CoA dehydrogenase
MAETPFAAAAPAGDATPRLARSLFHDLFSPQEIRSLREEVRAFAEAVVSPRAHAIGHTEESRQAFAHDVFDAMAKADLFGIPFASSDGGRGLIHRAAATAVAIEELAYFSNSVAAIYDVHCILAGNALTQASPELRREYLGPLIAGEKIGCFATSEPVASSDLSVGVMSTEVKVSGDTAIVSGHKRWITNSPVADFVVLLCKDGDRMTEIVVDLDSPGVTVGIPDRKLGNHGQLTADIHFDRVDVPVSHIVGQRGHGLRVALQTLTYGRIGIAASGVGMAQAVFDESVKRMKSRVAFGRRLGEYQYWQFKMAERATEIENARNLYLKAALRMDAGEAFPEPEAAMAKWYATNLAAEFARDGVQIFGGYGFMEELSQDGTHYRVEEIYRDAKIAEIYEGTNEIQKWIIARTIFGKDLTG